MLISEFSDRISSSSAKVSKLNQHCFPKWIRRFSTFVDGLPGGIDAVNFETVVKFSQELKDTGIPAWKRLQTICFAGVFHAIAVSAVPQILAPDC